jgi:CheY-like chemotaxis protein
MNKRLQVLLVEDNALDILMTRKAVMSWPVDNDLHVVEDGEEAMDLVLGNGLKHVRYIPNLIILDLNLPKKSGVEILRAIRNNPEWSDLMVVVLTTTNSKNEMGQCEQLGATRCITKPMGVDQYIEMIDSIKDLWLSKTI